MRVEVRKEITQPALLLVSWGSLSNVKRQSKYGQYSKTTKIIYDIDYINKKNTNNERENYKKKTFQTIVLRNIVVNTNWTGATIMCQATLQGRKIFSSYSKSQIETIQRLSTLPPRQWMFAIWNSRTWSTKMDRGLCSLPTRDTGKSRFLNLFPEAKRIHYRQNKCEL